MDRCFQLHQVSVPDGVVLQLDGPLGGDETATLSDAIDALDPLRPRSITLDMQELSAIDSKGLGYLVRLQKQCQERAIHFALRQPPEPVLNLLRVTNLMHIFHVESACGPPPVEVLVIDDEELVLSFSSIFLERAGFKVHGALCPSAALALLREHGPHIGVVMMDLSLPEMSGAELINALRALKPDVRILISSGLSDQELAEAAAPECVCGVLQKPYRGEQLLAAMRQALQER